METCSTCKENKLSNDFYKRADGTLFKKCKDCTREKAKQYRDNNPDKLKEERERNKDNYNAAKRKWDRGNKDRVKTANTASKSLHYALKTEKVTKGEKCEFCGVEDKPLDGAHYDYSKPLEVKWLCKSCHVRWDKERPKTKAHKPASNHPWRNQASSKVMKWAKEKSHKSDINNWKKGGGFDPWK